MNWRFTKKRASSAHATISSAERPLSRWLMASYTSSASAMEASLVSTRRTSRPGISSSIWESSTLAVLNVPERPLVKLRNTAGLPCSCAHSNAARSEGMGSWAVCGSLPFRMLS